MKLIVGLGNPGLRYRNTRHNIGFLVVKEIAGRFNIAVRKRRCRGILGEGKGCGEKITLFMPQTYMNLSGEAVREIAKAKKIESIDLLVICDDINLQFGLIRLRKSGSSGGHNGLESIINCMGTSGFPRLRIGIGRDRVSGNTSNFVLRPFSGDEISHINCIIGEGADCVNKWIEEGADKAMSSFNKRQGL
ncbi:MAG: aminoacyl-tRNA hydrolase [Candidatus Omnitrophota bacterium]